MENFTKVQALPASKYPLNSSGGACYHGFIEPDGQFVWCFVIDRSLLSTVKNPRDD